MKIRIRVLLWFACLLLLLNYFASHQAFAWMTTTTTTTLLQDTATFRSLRRTIITDPIRKSIRGAGIRVVLGSTTAYGAVTTSLTKRRRHDVILRLSADEPAENIGTFSDDNEQQQRQQREEQDNTILRQEKRALWKEFVTIGGPALIQLAAEPLASLVDTAYLGRLGPEILGGAGVAISAQYAVSKLYNDPLLRTSISLVASQDGQARQQAAESSGSSSSSSSNMSSAVDTDTGAEEQQGLQKKRQEADAKLSIAVCSALLLAGTVGIIQMLVYSIFCAGITRSMGVNPSSPMWHSAVSYLQVRAVGTPAATLWLVTNGIFRGLGDTKTPLIYSLLFTVLNIVLDPLFIFVFHWGASGAAAGTALAQYIALVPLLLALHRKVPLNDMFRQLGRLKSSLLEYAKAGSLVLVRTFGKVLAYSVCARQAALLGSVAAAAYNLTFQLGFATTQICEAVAVAVQTLLAREMAEAKTSKTLRSRQNHTAKVRFLVNTAVLVGGTVATTLSLSTFLRRDWILKGLTTSESVQQAAAAIFPAVLLTQIFKGLAYPVNGIIMGGLDWFFSMLVMWLSNVVCVSMIRWFARGGAVVSLGQIWWALAAFMATQVVAGTMRYESKTGVWKILRRPKDKNEDAVPSLA